MNSEAFASGVAAPQGGLNVWMGWRLRVLMAFALGACVLVFLLMRWLAESPELPLRWDGHDAQGVPQLILAGGEGKKVTALQATNGRSLMPPALAMIAPRWLADDGARRAQLQWRRELQAASESGPLQATLADASVRTIVAQPRGQSGLGGWFWPLAALALLLVLLGAVVVLAQPHPGNALYAMLAWAQAAALVQQAVLSLPGLWVHPALLAMDLPLRGALDMLALGALLHGLVRYPRRRPHWRGWAASGWAVAALTLALAPRMPWQWGALQLGETCMAAAACWVAWHPASQPEGASQRQTRYLLSAAFAGLLLLTASSAAVLHAPASFEPAQTWLVSLWPVLVTVLLVMPLLLRSRQLMREFALLASISAVAASLDLLFVAVFSMSGFSSLALVVFIALGLYAGLRQWLFDRMAGTTVLTTERVFEQLYRAVRVVQAEPDRHAEQVAAVLRHLFEPLEVLHSARPVIVARVSGGGGTLLVPIPSLAEAQAPPADGGVPRTSPGSRSVATLVLRHARRGQRVFTLEDARLANRVVEQLRRAVIYDLAVERGRTEERLRIAQDLHDDIGARLLTLMYQAPSAAIEDYIRHTLKDLKTLTRGLAAGDHQLSHAMAEWRSDIDQRCAAANVELDWAVQLDQDVKLGVVPWSGLTRVLRELVSNTLHHAQAQTLTVRLRLLNGEFSLRVTDDGRGVEPHRWAQGLGLGGVRKRVKLLGGTVVWRQEAPRGITCEVRVPNLGAASAVAG